MIRQPICVLLAHVDHGKTSILDSIRNTSVADKEAGGITQNITAHSIELNKIQETCGDLLKNINLTIPGILFIDSPGHEAFTTLRKRGGNIADIAILVIDINEGAKPQTLEAIEILKNSKTPFVIAANKIDRVGGFNSNKKPILQNIKEQQEFVLADIETKLYKIVQTLHEQGLQSERFDRVKDHTKQVAIIPCSAKTKDGLPELLMVVSGLAQKFLEQSLETDLEKPAKGTILEVTEEKGIGKTLDVVIYDGKIKQNDTILIGTLNEPIKTKVKCLFKYEKSKLKEQKEVHASAGIKISAPDLDEAIPGMPIRVANKKENEIIKELQQEIDEVTIDTDNEGIIAKADTLGSLEALVSLLKDKEVKIKKAAIGNITKTDIAEASSNEDPLNQIVVGFNVKILEESKDVRIITNEVVYKIVDDIVEYKEKKSKELESKEFENLVKPFKLKIMPGCMFRQLNPAIVGVDVLIGTARAGTPLMTSEGKKLTELKEIQDNKETVSEAKQGKEVAISLPNVTCGRQIKENDVLYSNIPQEDFKKLKKLMKKYLNESEVQLLKEIAKIKRNVNPTWGM
ncbi:translation initiation factor IF-2 [Candidatus Woesearchaeota archaeon]|nr:translation initiation factor IF-2 [Candidatus Woesearchaeota archaeon]MBT4322298.1 translation initiation factor IF-2 [Candidatus Woesearchaeota archaeon]